jgi:hypothetical protein
VRPKDNIEFELEVECCDFVYPFAAETDYSDTNALNSLGIRSG